MLALGLLCNFDVDLNICFHQSQQLAGCFGASISSLYTGMHTRRSDQMLLCKSSESRSDSDIANCEGTE